MCQKKQCVVVIPVYKPLDKIERSFLEQAVAMTEGFDKIFVAPEGLQEDTTFGEVLSSIPFQYFDKSYFANIAGYNYLMLSEEFYARFDDYEYILIHQPDAYLFHPSLKEWCDAGYSYIGAPWLKPKKLKRGKFYHFLLQYFRFLYPSKKRKLHECYNAVGNGGLSLRKIADYLTILRSDKAKAVLTKYRTRLIEESLFNEDIFWSVEAPRLLPTFKKPTWEVAAKFALETYCDFAYAHNGDYLPFGCHAPHVHQPEFWEKYIPNL